MRYFIAHLLLLASISVNAAVISYEFDGAFDRSVDAGADVTFGQLFYATFSYDDAAPLFSISDEGTRARYNTGTISITTGSNFYDATVGPQLQILDNWIGSTGSVRDDFFLSVNMPDASGPGYYLLQLNMIDWTAASLSSLDIPDRAKVEEMATNGRLFLRRFSSPGNEEWAASGYFSSITPVPLPAAIWLFSSALLALTAKASR